MPDAPDTPGTSDRMIAAMYDELRRIAARVVQDRGGAGVLQPTAVVHEAYLKLAGADPGAWTSDAHFLAVAARAVRQVLIDEARSSRRQKRGGDMRPLSLDTSIMGADTPCADALELEEVIAQLDREDPRAASVVELRFYGGMTIPQVASHLGLSTPTVERDWRFARARMFDLLFREP